MVYELENAIKKNQVTQNYFRIYMLKKEKYFNFSKIRINY